MTRHVVLGAGPVSRTIVASLNRRSIDVDVVSRMLHYCYIAIIL